jgi:hypothetical protein
VSFVFALKQVVEQKLGAAVRDGALRDAFHDFERVVDNLALHAFEIYAGCREKLYEIRLKELKNKTYKLVERVNAMPPRARAEGRGGAPPRAGAERPTTRRRSEQADPEEGRVLKLSEAPEKKKE